MSIIHKPTEKLVAATGRLTPRLVAAALLALSLLGVLAGCGGGGGGGGGY